MEDICQSLVELSRNLFVIDASQHYKDAGYESFESDCEKALGIFTTKVQAVMVVQDQRLPRPNKAGPTGLFNGFF